MELTNGSKMRYQWQFKNAAGEWEDIFGATGSHYSLGKQFAKGEEYELRAKITNPAGKLSFTESISLSVAGKAGSGLQSREDGPSIDSERLMDAGEEIAVTKTATNGQILWLLAGLAALAILATLAVSWKRRSR